MYLRILIGLLICAPLLTAADGPILQRWDFEGKRPFHDLGIEGEPPVVITDMRNPANKVMHAVLKPHAKLPGRSEVRFDKITVGQERWVGCRIFRPDQDQHPRVCMFQLGPVSGAPRRPGKGLYQILSKRVGDNLSWSLKGYLSRVKSKDVESQAGQVVVRTWDDFVMHIKLRSDAQGLIELWRNGEKMLEWKGQNAFSGDSIAVKWGAYIGIGNDAEVETNVYFDDIVIGDETARYEDVSPSGKSPLLPLITSRPAIAVSPGTDFSTTLTATAGPCTGWSAKALPEWLQLDPSLGALSGKIPADLNGPVRIELSVANSSGTGTSRLTLAPAAQVLPQLVTESFTGTVGTPVKSLASGLRRWALIPRSVESSPNYQRPFWIRYQGLPKGLEGNSSFQIAGTPEEAGHFSVQIEAENDFGIIQGAVEVEIMPAGAAPLSGLAAPPAPLVQP